MQESPAAAEVSGGRAQVGRSEAIVNVERAHRQDWNIGAREGVREAMCSKMFG